MGYKATVIGGSLNLRASTSTSSARLAIIPNGATIDVKTISGNTWRKAYYNNKLGYVMQAYLNENTSQRTYGVEACERYGEALLQQGSTGPNVLTLQQDLRNAGLHGFNDNDGIFGSNTRDAVIDYQQMSNLSADGIVGIDTKRSLYSSVVLG